MKNLKEFKNLLKYLKNDKWKIIIASTLIIIASLAGIAYGYLNGLAIESITNLDLKTSVISLLICLGISIVFSGILNELGMYLFKKAEINMTNKISEQAYKKTLNLPTYAFEEKTSGELINRITHDADVLSNTFGQLLQMVTRILNCLVILVYVFYNSLIIGIEIVVFVILMILVSRYFSPKLKKTHKELRAIDDQYTSHVTESIRGIREIKTLGIKFNMFSETRNLLSKLLSKKTKESKLNMDYAIITEITQSFLELGVFITCAVLLYKSQINLGFFVAMTYYVYNYVWIVENLTEINKMYQRVVVSVTRINEILENRLFQDEKFGKTRKSKCAGYIEFDNVSFSYKENEKVLKNLNVEFVPNKKIALVGKSGGGKSTIFNLITKIYNVNKGTILIDGEDIQELDETTLRNHISIIRQEPFVFNRTIKENFKMVNPKITLNEIREYARLAYLDDFIMSLPKKYDTVLGEGGTNLSGGQKQRLSIARVLAKKSKIILLDEATSALDNESQEYISKTIDNLVKNHTVIIVAHRLSTIIDSDIIYVIDKGKVADSGTHDELIEKSKVYQSLYNSEVS